MLSGLPVFTGISVTYDSYQDSSLALRMTGVERKKSFGILFSLLVFTGVPVTYDAFQDSSLALRMTAAGNGAKDTKLEA